MDTYKCEAITGTNYMDLSCSGGQVLSILRANYGRTDRSLCIEGVNNNRDDCTASRSLDLVRDK